MVFGNSGGASGSGVGFTRHPATGERQLYLDFRFNGQGEDVVAGRYRPDDTERLRRTLPSVWQQLHETSGKLEWLFRDAQDFEFTLQSGELFLLQSRAAKRSDWAAVKIAVDLVAEGLLEPEVALSRIEEIDLASVSKTRIAVDSAAPLAGAQAASLGVASGAIALDVESAERLAARGPVILVRRDIETSDIGGIALAAGILTVSGSRTSHAAVVARQLGKVCLVGCVDLEIDLSRRRCRIGPQTLHEGDVVSLDGNEGQVYAGAVEVVTERPERELREISRWKRKAPGLPVASAASPVPDATVDGKTATSR
jgi:pyruvate,orthophosphate dikinase